MNIRSIHFSIPAVLVLMMSCALPAAPAPAPGILAPSAPPVLTNIIQILSLAPEEAGAGRAVRLRGILTYYDVPWKFGFVQDETAGIFIKLKHLTNSFKAGQLIEVDGLSDPGGFAPLIDPRAIRVVGEPGLPPARQTTVADMLTGREDCQRVEVQGLVQAASQENGVLTLWIAAGREEFSARVQRVPANDSPARWVDTEVRLRGCAGAIFNQRRQFMGVQLMVPVADDAIIEKAAPASREDVPLRPLASLWRFNPKGQVQHRIRVRGTVTYQKPGEFLFVQDGDAVVFARSPEKTVVQPGDFVDVAGFPAVENGKSTLRHADYRVVERRTPPAATAVTGAELSQGTLDGRLIQVEGVVLEDWVKTDGEWMLVLESKRTILTARLPRSSERDAGPSLPKGSLVRLTGICWNDFNEAIHTTGAAVLLRGRADAELMRGAPWWTMARSRVVVYVLGFFTLAALAGMAILGRQIRQRKRTEKQILEKEMFIRNVLDTVPNLIFVKDREGRFTLVNQALARFFGLTVETMTGKFDTELTPDPEMVRKFRQDDLAVMDSQQEKVIAEEKVLNQQGLELWLHTVKRPLLSADGQVHHMLGVATDITASKRAEERLRDSEALYQSLVQHMPANLLRKDRDGRLTFANALALKTMNKTAGEIVGKTDFDLFPDELARKYRQDDCRILESGSVFEDVEAHRASGGEELYVQVLKTPVHDARGEITGIQILFWDVTERERTKRELSYQKDLLDSLLQGIPDRVYFKDRESRFVKCSREVARSLGWDDPSLVVGKTDFDFFTEEHARPAFEAEQEIMRTGRPLVGVIEKETWKDRPVTWVLTTKMPWRDKDGAIIGTLGISKDVTALKRAEEELAYEREQFRAFLENIPDCVYFKDRQSRFVRASRALVERFRFSEEDLLKGKTDFDYFSEEHARPAFEDEQEIIRTRQPIIGKLEKETYPDGTVTWALTTKMPWLDKQGQVVGTFGISKDITSLKQAEARIEQVHKQLLETSRQAGMAEVATSVLHNVGNVLNSVNVSASLLAEGVRKSKVSSLARVTALLHAHAHDLATFITQDEKGRQLPGYLDQLAEHLAQEQAVLIKEVDSLTKNVEHIKEIVAMQQSYARVSGVVETVPVEELVEDALRMNVGAFVRHDVEVVREYGEAPLVTVDKHKVLQILVNVLRNAKYACDDAGRKDKRVTVRVGLNPAGLVQIDVADNGVGIAPENLTRIFHHGFTTRKDGHGFGLHSGANAAKEMGGRLTAHSEGPGRGATFTLELPRNPSQQLVP